MIEDKRVQRIRMASKGIATGFSSGGTWEIVKEFKGNSHEKGGIDIEIKDGMITRSSGIEPEYIAGGGFWKDLGAGAFGVLKGTLDTVTMGATAPLTTMAYKGLQDLGGSTEEEKREQDSIAGYGQLGGAVLGGIVTGGATTGSAIASGSEGLGQGIAKGSESEDWAGTVGAGISAAGGIAGMATGNAGFAGKGASALGKAGKAGADWGKVGQGINKMQKIAPYIRMGAGALSGLTAQQQQQQKTAVQAMQPVQAPAPPAAAFAINNARMNVRAMDDPYTASQQEGIPKYGLRYISKYGIV